MMNQIMKFVAATAFAVTLAGAASAQQAAGAINPVGTWKMENGKVTVEVAYCGEAKICAKIIALAKPLNKQGKPKVDKENPNPALRSRPLIGLQLIDGMSPDGENRWKGQIYNADDGNIYRSTAVLAGDTMLVRGFWGPFSKKMNFIRVK
jgi:uncharacterized protein (DUF2147 family)